MARTNPSHFSHKTIPDGSRRASTEIAQCAREPCAGTLDHLALSKFLSLFPRCCNSLAICYRNSVPETLPNLPHHRAGSYGVVIHPRSLIRLIFLLRSSELCSDNTSSNFNWSSSTYCSCYYYYYMNGTVRRLFARRPFLAFVWTSIALVLLLSLISNSGSGRVAIIVVLVAWIFLPFALSRYLSYRKQVTRARRITEANRVKTERANTRAALLLETVAEEEESGPVVDGQTCAICLQDGSIGGNWVKLKSCGHEFHKTCMKEVIAHDDYGASSHQRGRQYYYHHHAPVVSSCPLCRAPLMLNDNDDVKYPTTCSTTAIIPVQQSYTTTGSAIPISAAAASLYLDV